MKNSIFLTLSMLLSGGSAFAQNYAGPVGIGTTTPQATLDVNGHQIIRGNLSFAPDQTEHFISGSANGGAIRIRPNSASTIDRGLQFGNMDNNGIFSAKMIVGQDGSVGIGTLTPIANLEVKGQTIWDGATTFRLTNNATDYGRVNLILTSRFQSGNDTWAFGSGSRNSIVFAQNESGSMQNVGGSGVESISIAMEGNSKSLGFMTIQNGHNPNMVMTQAGNIGIGTTTPRERLSVNGKIRAQEIKVDTSNWPDYVFKPEYTLLPLEELNVFIDKNQHLPGIPSEKEVIKNGVDLGDMNGKLLKKVEELTLYIIQMNKELQELKAKQSK